MRALLAVVVLTALAGCASNEYSKVPEPTGEWVPANPPSLMAEATPAPQPPARHTIRRHHPFRPARAPAAAGDRVAVQ